MSPLPRNNTAYSEYVFSNITSILIERGGAYDVKDLAAMVGLKPTQHFTRRIRQMVSEGRLKAHPVFTPRGGLSVVYTLPDMSEKEFEVQYS